MADEKVGDSSTKIKVSYQSENMLETGSFYISDTQSVILTYDRASGAFRPMISSVDDAGNVTYFQDGSGSKVYCTGFEITRGNRTKTVVLVRDTGKVYINE
jgi:hypothetical protein